MSVRVFYPPDKPTDPVKQAGTEGTEGSKRSEPTKTRTRTLFLAGSIEMGKAPDWQQLVIDKLRIHLPETFGFLNVLNPRRKDWNSSWEQSISNPFFVEQVQWELGGLEEADVIVMYLASNTVSPISLLELGLHAGSGKVIVYCEDGFSRKGNVDIVCRLYGVTQVGSQDELLEVLLASLAN